MNWIISQRNRFRHRFQFYIMRFLGVSQISKNVPKSTWFPHPSGIIISKRAKIGENCIIFQNVTIGAKGIGKKENPIIENNVTIGAGAVILGKITIKKGTTITANSLTVGD